MKENNFDKKISLYEKLGAKQFQKVVLKFDTIKWGIIQKIVPNYIKYSDKLIDRQCNKMLKKAKSEEERNHLKKRSALIKMQARKEFNTKKNTNYYISRKPSEFIKYLEMNKAIHKRGLICNSILIPIGIGAYCLNLKFAIPFLIFEALDTFKNFQCVNIQNYNICRIKKIENKLKIKEKEQEKQKIKKYGQAYELIGNIIEDKKDIISIDDIISNIKSKEQLEQLRELISEEKFIRQKEQEKAKGKVKRKY